MCPVHVELVWEMKKTLTYETTLINLEYWVRLVGCWVVWSKRNILAIGEQGNDKCENFKATVFAVATVPIANDTYRVLQRQTRYRNDKK